MKDIQLLQKAQALCRGCTCGRQHSLLTKEIYAGKNAGQALAKLLAPFARPLFVFDERTRVAAGAFLDPGRGDSVLLQGQQLHADAGTLGQILLGVRDETDVLVAVGAGTVNDSVRLLAHRLHLPYVVLGTAPSMDGYASSVSPVIADGMKITYEAVAPMAVVFDEEVLRAAPGKMIAAGLGDMLGKHVALLDWELAHHVVGEYRCEGIVELMEEAVALCEGTAAGLARREGDAVLTLAQGLGLSGLAMQLMGNSRPASGSEHHMAHFLEMMQMQNGQAPSLHGDKVGVTTLYMIEFYHRLFQTRREPRPVDLARWEALLKDGYQGLAEGFLRLNPLEKGENVSLAEQYSRFCGCFDAFRQKADALYAKKDEYKAMLRACGGPVSAEEIGATPQQMKQAMLCAFLLRPRYAALRMCYYFGWLEEIVDEIFA